MQGTSQLWSSRDALHQRVASPVVGLENGGNFVGSLDLALPTVDRADRRQGCSRTPRAVPRSRSGQCVRPPAIGEHRVDRKHAHAWARPSSCAPQIVAASRRAPVAWWSTASQIAIPERTVTMPRMICVPNAEWIAIDAARAPVIFTLRANSTRTATTTHAHQRCMKWRKIEVVGHREERAVRPVDPVGHEVAVHRRPGVRDIAGAKARDPAPSISWTKRMASAKAPQPVNRDGRASGSRASGEGQRSPDQRREQEQGKQQMRRKSIGADLGAVPRGPTRP